MLHCTLEIPLASPKFPLPSNTLEYCCSNMPAQHVLAELVGHWQGLYSTTVTFKLH